MLDHIFYILYAFRHSVVELWHTMQNETDTYKDIKYATLCRIFQQDLFLEKVKYAWVLLEEH